MRATQAIFALLVLGACGPGPNTPDEWWLSRTPVLGGWIVRTTHLPRGTMALASSGFVFVPDPEHEWQLDDKHKPK